jgi:hypothetical protein
MRCEPLISPTLQELPMSKGHVSPWKADQSCPYNTVCSRKTRAGSGVRNPSWNWYHPTTSLVRQMIEPGSRIMMQERSCRHGLVAAGVSRSRCR